MKAELKMYQAKVYEYKYDIEKLDKDMKMLKLSYFAQKRQAATSTADFANFQSTNVEEAFKSTLMNPDELSQAAILAVAAADHATSGIARLEAIHQMNQRNDAAEGQIQFDHSQQNFQDEFLEMIPEKE